MDDIPKIKKGDRVAYSAKFLKNTGDHSHATASLRGTIEDLQDYGPKLTIANVRWDNGELWTINTANLVRADRLHLEPR